MFQTRNLNLVDVLLLVWCEVNSKILGRQEGNFKPRIFINSKHYAV